MNHSSLIADVRKAFIHQLTYFEENATNLLETNYAEQFREKSLLGVNIKRYAALLTSLLKRNDDAMLVTLEQVVVIGSEVTIAYDDGTQDTFTVVLPSDVNPDHNRISLFSPLGNRLLSRTKGDKVAVQTPEFEYEVQIIAIKAP